MRLKAEEEKKGEWEGRVVHCNDGEKNAAYQHAGNAIYTTKYSVVTFLPKALFEQFRRVANLYFLLVAVVTCTPVSPITPSTTIGPLLLVLSFSLVREGAEDWQRFRSDKASNERSVEVVRQRAWEAIPWHSVRVGDLVRVKGGEFFPADLLLLATTNADGICYIATSNLDGESNLKIRKAVEATCSLVDAPEASRMQGRVECEEPNSSLYTFSGTLVMQKQRVACTPNQLLLRGCSLRNTEWVVGVVIFTGTETKMMMGGTAPPSKRSSLEKQLDKVVLALLALLLLLCVLGGASYGYTTRSRSTYLELQQVDFWKQRKMDNLRDRSVVAVLAMFTFLVLLSPIIPISLYVAMEVVKVVQCSYFINQDMHMFHVTHASARTSSLVEELGQIDIIFSDKTGTLTCNSMEFFQCSIAGTCYGDCPRPPGLPAIPGFSFYDPRLMQGQWRQEANAETCMEFFRCLAICHTVVVEEQQEEEEEQHVRYQAASPDEAALVVAAREMGFSLSKRSPAGVRIREQHLQGEMEYAVVNVMEFDSSRKRQSVICCHPGGRLVLYCKGADDVIFSRLRPDSPHQESTLRQLETFGAQGLRTLCLAYRDVEPAEYQTWVQSKSQADAMESDLTLLGCTAILDKLQDGVPESIQTLRTAGIQVWVLTGDKMETAVNIAFSCRLLHHGMHQIRVSDKESLQAALQAPRSSDMALVLDGACLSEAMQQAGLLDLAMQCKAVVCSRVTPVQKAEVVRSVRQGSRKITLAVGDGANDVGMIRAADLGVGISGVEGTQAAAASDFSISQFRFLTELLLVHGRWSHVRMAMLVSYFVYKNMALALTTFWFNVHTEMSGQPMYADWYQALYNVLFTSVPVVVVGLLEQDVGKEAARENPQLYMARERLGGMNMAAWVAAGVWHSLALLYVPLLGGAWEVGMWELGETVFTALVLTVNLQLAMAASFLTFWHAVTLLGSVCVYVAFAMLYAAVESDYDSLDTLGILYNLLPMPCFWLSLFLAPTAALGLDFLLHACLRLARPRDAHILQERDAFPHALPEQLQQRRSLLLERRNTLQLRKASMADRRRSSIHVARRSTVPISAPAPEPDLEMAAQNKLPPPQVPRPAVPFQSRRQSMAVVRKSLVRELEEGIDVTRSIDAVKEMVGMDNVWETRRRESLGMGKKEVKMVERKHTGFAFESPSYESFYAEQEGVEPPVKSAWEVARRASMKLPRRRSVDYG